MSGNPVHPPYQKTLIPHPPKVDTACGHNYYKAGLYE